MPRTRAHRRGRGVLGRHGPQGVLSRGGRDRQRGRAGQGAQGERGMAVETPVQLAETDDRHGQRLVLRRRVHPAGGLRPGLRRRGRAIRLVRGELGHSARRRGVQGARRDRQQAGRALPHHDRRTVRRPRGGCHAPCQRSRAGRSTPRANPRGRRQTGREQPDRAARGQGRLQGGRGHALGPGRGLTSTPNSTSPSSPTARAPAPKGSASSWTTRATDPA